MKPTPIDMSYRIETRKDRNGATSWVVAEEYRGALALADKRKQVKRGNRA